MLALAASGLGGSRPSGATSPWTITVAQERSGSPLWAYPFLSGDELSVQNVQDFEQLTYRPLYFFDGATAPSLDASRSLAEPPVYDHADTSVSITMKSGPRWSNGQAVSAAGVVEWMNLLAAFPGIWADYLAPLSSGQLAGIPDDVRAIAVHGQTLTLTLAGPVDPTWFTDNELSQITPLPAAWDRYEPAHPHVPMTGPGSISAHGGHFTGPTASAGCYGDAWIGDGNDGPSDAVRDPLGTETVVPKAEASSAARCVDVVELMRSMSADAADYSNARTDVAATWSLSDGPWRLSTYSASTGALTMLANDRPGVTGPRPTAGGLQFVPCVSDRACLALLKSGGVVQGTLPIGDAPRISALAGAPSHNPLAKEGYHETVTAPWAITYAPYNFDSTSGARGEAGLVLRQLYVRQALQLLVDQPTMVRSSLGGYGVATTAPVPTNPPNRLAAPLSNPYPFDVARARSFLSTHGWRVASGSVSTCETPRACGAGITEGTPLSFTMLYAPGSDALTRSLSLLRRDALDAGISIHLDQVTETELLSDVEGHGTSWDLASWDGGWRYAPDYYPSGEWLFARGSAWNVGDYDDPTASTLVDDTLTSPTALSGYDRFVATRVPVLWLPTPVTLTETLGKVHGVVVSPIGAFTPESWRL